MARKTRKPQSRGPCNFCQKDYTRGRLVTHLATCLHRQKARAKSTFGEIQPLHQIAIMAEGNEHWLHLELKEDTTLQELDHYLRQLWFEHGKHISTFRPWPKRDESGNVIDYPPETPMTTEIAELWEQGDIFAYDYDPQFTTHLKIQVTGIYLAKPVSEHAITLLARNNPVQMKCLVPKCPEPATYICIECFQGAKKSYGLCDDHAESHPCEKYGLPTPLVNSPRVTTPNNIEPNE